MKATLETQRTRFLGYIRQLCVACFKRASLERIELCPESVNEPDTDALQRHAKLRVRISTLAQTLREQEEKANKAIGVLALLNGVEPEPPVRIAACLLLAKSISDSVAGRIRTVGEVANFSVGNQSPEDLLTIRRAFNRASGVLRPHCNIVVRELALDECFVSLTERAVCKMLSLPPQEGIEFEILSEHRRRQWA